MLREGERESNNERERERERDSIKKINMKMFIASIEKLSKIFGWPSWLMKTKMLQNQNLFWDQLHNLEWQLSSEKMIVGSSPITYTPTIWNCSKYSGAKGCFTKLCFWLILVSNFSCILINPLNLVLIRKLPKQSQST